jgi:hypothetical protein
MTGTHSRSLYRLLRALASIGIFAEVGQKRFQLTPLAEPLRSDVPDSLRAFAIYFGINWHWNVWGELPYSVKTGKPAFEHLTGKAVFDYFPQNPEHAQIFNNAMTSLSASVGAAAIAAYDFSGIKKLVYNQRAGSISDSSLANGTHIGFGTFNNTASFDDLKVMATASSWTPPPPNYVLREEFSSSSASNFKVVKGGT